ncbi:DUF4190 domain-containing protein [Streptomyces sp. CA-294286]|uniref:DUF4190 domain-containing protein n=1 Tax=Streptomyces sp. CA-294286 TaxID=3240070 RepID=UPI003D94FAAB
MAIPPPPPEQPWDRPRQPSPQDPYDSHDPEARQAPAVPQSPHAPQNPQLSQDAQLPQDPAVPQSPHAPQNPQLPQDQTAPPSPHAPQSPHAPPPQAYGAPSFGAPAPGQSPYGQPPYGQSPYGQSPHPQPSYPQAPYGQSPYAAHPYGPPPAPPAANGLAVASLVTGIVCCVPPLGLILGLVALAQIKKRGDSGKGLAVAGMVLSSLSVVLVLVGLLTGGLNSLGEELRKGASSSNKSVEDLRTGQCFNTPDGSLEGTTYDVEVVGCDKPHDAEVFGTFDLADAKAYPGDEKISRVADQRCAIAEKSYTGGRTVDVDSYYLMPDPRGWRLGDRGVTCVFGDESGDRLTGSLRDTGSGDSGEPGGVDGTDGADDVQGEEV